jgi:hypothetical protein
MKRKMLSSDLFTGSVSIRSSAPTLLSEPRPAMATDFGQVVNLIPRQSKVKMGLGSKTSRTFWRTNLGTP